LIQKSHSTKSPKYYRGWVVGGAVSSTGAAAGALSTGALTSGSTAGAPMAGGTCGLTGNTDPAGGIEGVCGSV